MKRINVVSQKAMAEQFKNHQSWSGLNDQGSELSQFLNTVCLDDNDGSKLSISKLRNLGLLWCEGDPSEKVPEFFENLQDPFSKQISANDKDFKPNFEKLLLFATKMIVEQESIFMKQPKIVTDNQLEEIREKFDEISEEFIDTVFDVEAKLDRKDWEHDVA